MKMTVEHFSDLKQGLTRVEVEYPKARHAYAVIGHSDERYRWDVLHKALNSGYIRASFHTWYQYLLDVHLSTALRKALGGSK